MNHKIETLQDIIKCTNENNLDSFLKDFKIFLQMANSFKKIDGLQGELSRRSVQQFIWIEARGEKDFTKDINSHFLFVKYMNQFYDYNDNIGEGDIYLNIVTKKKITETELYNKWLKEKSKYHGND